VDLNLQDYTVLIA